MSNDLDSKLAAATARWGDLALEIMEIVLVKRVLDGKEADPQERISVILDSVYQVGFAAGERRGVEVGVKAACDTTDAILDLMRPPHARS